MNYSDVLANARECIGKYCKACPVCNGVACKNQIPGPGAKGVGDTAIRNYNKWADIRVNMDTLCENGTPDTHVELFGRSFKYPFFAGPVGAVNLHYSDTYTDMTYNDVLVRACAESGIAAFTGDGTNPDVMTMATAAIYMRWLGYFFIFMGIKMATDGVLRGLGIMRPFLIANMVNLAIRLSVALICAPRFGIAFVWLAVPAGWLANFLISYAALRRSWPEDKAAVSQ